MRVSLRTCTMLTVCLFFGCSVVFAGNVTLPNEFTAGETAVASEVNANFTAIERAVDDNDSRITAIEGAMDVDTASSYKAYLRLTGETQGDIIGSVTEPGYEESIRVLSTSHEVISPRDATTGLPTGRRQHTPFVIIKEVDRTSPLFYRMLVNNENITSWDLQFIEPSKAGSEIHTYTIQLINAQIADIQHENLGNEKVRETISFVYQKIRWIWEDGGIVTEDDWVSPVI